MTGSKGNQFRQSMYDLVDLFHRQLDPVLSGNETVHLIPSTSPIQALVVPGNAECTRFSNTLHALSDCRIRLFPIKSPTVPAGQERVRIVLHANNTTQQVEYLVSLIVRTLEGMGLLQTVASRL